MLWLECVRVCVRCPVWFFWTSWLNLPLHLPFVLTRPTSCRCRSGHQRGDHVHGGAAEGRHRAGGGQRGGQPRHAVSQGQGAEAHRGPYAREEGREGEVAVTFTWLDGSSSSFVFFLFCFSKKTQFVLYVLWDAPCVPLFFSLSGFLMKCSLLKSYFYSMIIIMCSICWCFLPLFSISPSPFICFFHSLFLSVFMSVSLSLLFPYFLILSLSASLFLTQDQEKWWLHHVEQSGTAKCQRQTGNDSQHRRLWPEEHGGHRWARDKEDFCESSTV